MVFLVLLLITKFQMHLKEGEQFKSQIDLSLAGWDGSDKWKELYGLSIGHKLGVNGGRTAHHLGNGLLDWQRKQADPGYFFCV